MQEARNIYRPSPAAETPLVRVAGISKAFGSIQALTEINLTLERGTVHAIAGHNGAGKSTLMKILSGVVRPDSGTIYLNGEAAIFSDPRHAQRSGISMAHQELSVVDDLDVAENIFLGREPVIWAGVTDRRQLDRMTLRLLDDLAIDLAPRTLCRDLSVGQRQMVEIARAMSWDANVMILDEPTAALGPTEQAALFQLIDRLRRKGIGFFYISHRLDEILSLADLITVLRDGQNAGSLSRDQCNHTNLVQLMLGHGVEKVTALNQHRDERVLEIRDLTSASGKLNRISFPLIHQ